MEKFEASVKVMRSYDYCHFEVTLGTDEPKTLDEINDMRQQAAILVDDAVRQYRTAKEKESVRFNAEWKKRDFLRKVEQIEKKPKGDWTPEDAAIMRSHEDSEFWRQFEEDDYFYDDGSREHHFSMLRKFKDSRVSA